MKILNLGCGVKTSSSPDVVNLDWSIYLRLRRNPVLRILALRLLKGQRLERFKSLPANILVHDLSKGIPFPADSIDVVYHSHMLEHLDREVAVSFLLEVKRVLRPGGVQRIVVPDFEYLCRAYLGHTAACEKGPDEVARHDEYIAAVIEQCVRRWGVGTAREPPLGRFFEKLVLGDARSKGETHRWMYDRFNLAALLTRLGFRTLRLQSYDVSMVPNWSQYGLDLNAAGNEYIPGSLYFEAQK